VAKKNKFDGIVVKRDVDGNGFVRSYDKNDRPCWGGDQPERVVLMHDLRKYASGLHIGQLGWTVPGTTDSYKWIDVLFDNGVQLPILVYGIERVIPERAVAIAADLIDKNRNTRFDADAVVAEQYNREWVKQEHSGWVDTDQAVELGSGPEEVYAFTFPSLKELAHLKDAAHYPVKIGFSGNQDAGAIQRIRNQMTEAAAFPQRPALLLVYRTWDGRALELLVHAELRRRNRKLGTAPGVEWFMTNETEVAELCTQLGPNVPKPASKPLSGASPGLSDLVAAGAQVELVRYPNSASVGIRITQPQPTTGTQ
jgi:T5orf172 domain